MDPDPQHWLWGLGSVNSTGTQAWAFCWLRFLIVTANVIRNSNTFEQIWSGHTKWELFGGIKLTVLIDMALSNQSELMDFSISSGKSYEKNCNISDKIVSRIGLNGTKLCCGRMIWLHGAASPLPFPSANCLSFSVFLCVAGPAYWQGSGREGADM
jgi:hypothetical protein